MSRVRCLLLLALLVSLNGCLSVDEYLNPKNSLYCDNFLVYDMCVRDMDRDGVAEFIYFEDSQEVFLYSEDALAQLPGNLGVHYCARVMDPDLVATTSRMLFIDDETSFMERSDIRGSLLLRYMTLMPDVAACNMAREQNGLAAE